MHADIEVKLPTNLMFPNKAALPTSGNNASASHEPWSYLSRCACMITLQDEAQEEGGAGPNPLWGLPPITRSPTK